MADNIIVVKIDGLDKLTTQLDHFADELYPSLMAANQEVGQEVIHSQGIDPYPAETAANYPPIPFYIRGRGTQLKTRNLNNSERLGTQFYIEPRDFGVAIGNRASYAKYVIGSLQAKSMDRIGWRKLYDSAVAKLPVITEIYQSWIDRILKRNHLK